MLQSARKVRILVGLVLGVALAAGAYGAEPEMAVAVATDRVLYEPGSAAQVTVSVANRGEVAFAGKVVVLARWEMGESKALAEEGVTVGAGETKVVKAEWAGMPAVMGAEVRAEVRDAQGKTVAAGSEYFNVWPGRDFARVGIHAGCSWMTSAEPAALAGNHALFDRYKQGYINLVEVFFTKSAVLNLAPVEDEWVGYFVQSKAACRDAMQYLHGLGMKTAVYVTSYGYHSLDDLEIPMRHPEWLAYNEAGQPDGVHCEVRNEDAFRFAPKRPGPNVGCFDGVNFNWTNQALLDYHVGQLIANQRMFGIDAVRYDGEPGAIWGKRDITGKSFPDAAGRAAERVRIVRYIRAQVGKALPEYGFMFNAGTAVGTGNPVDVEKGTLDPALLPVVEKGGSLCDEEMRGAYQAINPFHEWKRFADAVVSDVDLARRAGGYAYVLFPWTSTVHRNSDEIGYSILLAAGDHPWFCMPWLDLKNDPGGSHYPVQRELFAFATRFSAFLWGPGVERVRKAEEAVEVSSDKGEIWWRNFVHRRSVGGKQYVIVHLLNAPPSKEIGVTEQALPEPVEAVRVRFKGAVKRAWVATARPGAGGMAYGEAEVQDGEVRVGKLRVWTMVVAETA